MIDVQQIKHAALEHDIRTVQTRTELEHAREDTNLNTYRDELMSKVNEHLSELQKLDESKERTAQFKDAMLTKVNEHMAELEKEEAKKEEVSRIKNELMEKVHRHAAELEQLDAKKLDLAKYKTELLARAESHCKDVELAHEKEAQVRRFSLEMKEKIAQHESHLVERKKLAEKLKVEIISDTKKYQSLLDRLVV